VRAGRRLDGPRHAEYRTSDGYYACTDTGTHRTSTHRTSTHRTGTHRTGTHGTGARRHSARCHSTRRHGVHTRRHCTSIRRHGSGTPAKAPDVTTTEHTTKKNKPRNMTRQQEIERSIDSGTVPARYRKSVPKEYQQYIPFAK
jgi:hypothetical protein